MAIETKELDDIVRLTLEAVATSKDLPGSQSPAEVTMRERFAELVVLSMANLYGKTPVASTMFDRSMLKTVAQDMDDNEAGKLSGRAEDWMRLEGLVRVLEGQKSYTLNRPAMAVLSTRTEGGTLGEVMEKVAASYLADAPSPELRRRTRQLASYLFTRLGRS